MWNFLPPSGVATTVVDFTSDLSLLLTGLVGIVWLSVGMLAWMAALSRSALHAYGGQNASLCRLSGGGLTI